MRRSLISLIASVLLLGFGWFIPHSVFEVAFETPTTISATALPIEQFVEAAPVTALPLESPAPTQALDAVNNPYGELYFALSAPKEYYPPEVPPPGTIETISRLVRLPGSCVVGLETCLAPEPVKTPFDVNDILATDSSLLEWSPDGRYGLLVTHPEDKLSAGKTKEELKKIQHQSPSEFEVSPSTLYMFDAQLNTWQEVYRSERKFFYSPTWSPDGQWIAFQILSSVWGFHPSQADDGIYIIHPDGSDLQQLSAVKASIYGWIGNSLLLQHMKDLYPAIDYTMEMLTLDGEIKPLFESSRMAVYSLAPDGGALLAADAQGEYGGPPTKTVDVLALDGNVAHTLGTFMNYSSSIYPLVWSRDGSKVAFANLRRVYVGPRDGQKHLPSGIVGIPPDGPVREVYLADDTYTQPSFGGLQFSIDNKYLLIQVYDSFQRFVTVALDTGQVIPLELLAVDDDEQPGLFSWRP